MDHNQFAVALAEMEFGSLIPRLSEDLITLVKEVHSTNRSGAIQLTLKIKPAGGNGQVEIISEVKKTMPKPEPGKSLFFATEHGQLLRKDPRQKEFPFGQDGDEDAPRKVHRGGIVD